MEQKKRDLQGRGRKRGLVARRKRMMPCCMRVVHESEKESAVTLVGVSAP